MSDARTIQAQEAMAAGNLQEAMALLKGALQENPEDMEVRNLLMECQAGMMLQLQLSEKIKKAKVLLEQGLRENAEKALQEVLKADPGNREAMDLLHPPAAPDEDTASFGPTEFEMPPPFEPQAAEPVPSLPDLDATDEFAVDSLPPIGGPASFGDLPPAPAPAFGEMPELEALPPLEAPASTEGIPTLGAQGDFELAAFDAGPEATVLSGTPGPLSAEQSKVRQYIEEGKALEARGALQDAIDVWTRVFILDEENREAQGLIDAAKKKLQGDQGEIEHALAEGIAAFNSNQLDRARLHLEKVVQAFPGHKEAQYYLERMAKASAPPPPPAPPPPVQSPPPPVPSFTFEAPAAPFGQAPAAGPGEFEFDAAGGDAGFAATPPPPQPAAAPPPPLPPFVGEPGPAPGPAVKKTPVARPAKRGPSMGMILGAIGGVLVLAVGMFLASKFMGGDEEGATPATPSKLPGAAQNAVAPPSTVPTANAVQAAGTSPATVAAELIAQARISMEAKEYSRATALFQQALLAEKDNGEAQAGLEQAKALLLKQQEAEARNQKFIKDYTFAVGAFRDGEYKDSLTVAWRLVYPDDKLADELGKKNAIRRLLRDGYYNWAVKDLKVGNAASADKNLGEVLTIEGTDTQAKNLQQFAKKYLNDPPDALYWETVKTLSQRPFQEHQ